jgi:hypothetical protein
MKIAKIGRMFVLLLAILAGLCKQNVAWATDYTLTTTVTTDGVQSLADHSSPSTRYSLESVRFV